VAIDKEDKLKHRALNNAYALLRQRARSEHEIRRRLKLKGYTADMIDECVEALRRSGDIDDAKFARFWVESRMRSNPMGDVVLRHELKAKGVSDSVIADTLLAKAQTFDEYRIALDMAHERFKQYKKLDRKKAMKRMYDFLTRRGFKFDIVERIIGELAK
jgi:regulatory protein